LIIDDHTVTREAYIMVILDTVGIYSAVQEGHRCKMQAQDGIQQRRETNKNIGVRDGHDTVLEVQCDRESYVEQSILVCLGDGSGS
jgi:hypothetical protein